MKTVILSITIMLYALTGKSQSKEFNGAMGEALGQYATCKTVEDFQMLGNRFGLIANAEKTEWLPLYYHAHCYIIMSFMEPADLAKKDSYLDVAEKSIEKMLSMAPAEAEVYALQGFLFTGRLVINAMEPGNPRASVLKLQNEMGTAQFYGNDPAEYCAQAIELLAKWDDYKIKSPIYPSWGKDQVEGIVNECK